MFSAGAAVEALHRKRQLVQRLSRSRFPAIIAASPMRSDNLLAGRRMKTP